MSNLITLDRDDFLKVFTVKAKGAPAKGITPKTVTATITGLSGEFNTDNILNAMWGRGFAVALQSQARASVQPLVDEMELKGEVDYQFATDSIADTIEINFGQFILTGGNGSTKVDPIVAGQNRYNVFYQSALADGKSEANAEKYANEEIIKLMRKVN